MSFVVYENQNELYHYGTPRHSGRYPWGSGKNPQRARAFRQEVAELKKSGMSETEIANAFGINTSELRAAISIAKSEQRMADTAQALRLKEKGYSNVEIGKRMGINESSVRSLLDPAMQEKAAIGEATVNMLKQQISEKKYLDVGSGVEIQAGISRTKLNTAIAELEMEGYKVHYLQTEQLGTGKKTTIKVLTKDDVTYSEVSQNRVNIRTITDWTEDGGRSYLGLEPIKDLDSSRIKVRFSEEGGTDMDGIIQIRRGVEDLSLGDAKYAQVRIGVDGTHYLKGMAIYSDDMPDGVDVVFNTNKSQIVGKMGAMKGYKPDVNDPNYIKLKDEYLPDSLVNKKAKTHEEKKEIEIQRGKLESAAAKAVKNGEIRPDPDNPFGATVRQKHYTDSKGKDQLSPINIVGFPTKPESGEEGSWETWSKTLSSQFLSKQSPALAERQLKIAYDSQKAEFDSIMSIQNPAVRTRLLDSFADDCDSKAVHLKAAALPRQGSKVLIPVTSLKETECYAPTYRNGEQLALVRYPHAGTFEIPVVTVNNRNSEGKNVLGNARDAIGIHPKTASRLSGADFDGDTVLTIPYSKAIQVSNALKGLEDFDPKTAYPKYDGMKTISAKNKQTEMGKVSNLITDMTLKGATQDELARAVRHSMVVIDAEKHELNYKQSYIDNGIADLKVKYQGGTTSNPKGASTLISRASSEVRVDSRRPVTIVDTVDNPQLSGLVRKNEYSVDPSTGKKITVPRNETYVNSSGKTVTKSTKSTKMYETDDAMTLSSGTQMESIYGSHANSMKSLGDLARKESASAPSIKYSPSAKDAYQNEVASLKAKLEVANSNKPLERQAQLVANSVVAAKKEANPNLTASEIKKIKGQALEEARNRTGAKKQQILITDREWEAIQAGAISQNTLSQILNNTNLDDVKQLAMPRESAGLSPGQRARANQLLNAGYTQAEVADHLGISTNKLSRGLKGE